MPPPTKRRRFEDDDEDDDRPRRRRAEDDDVDEEEERPRSRRRADDDEDDDRPRRGKAKVKGSNGMAMTALVLGIVSFFCFALTGIPAIICGFLGMSKANKVGTGKGMAITGMVLGLIGTLLTGALGAGIYYATKGVKQVVEKVEQTGKTLQSSNNLKEIGMGMHQHHDAMSYVPGSFHRPTGGKAPPANPDDRLSWRFSLLPYTNNDILFKQFAQDQAWNSQANRQLSNTPLHVYSDPDGTISSQTRYRVFVGGGALFDGEPVGAKKGAGPLVLPQQVRFSGIVDGTSNTIFAIEASDTVPWAQHKEIAFDKARPLPQFGRLGSDSFVVLMCDGSVRPVKKTIKPETMKALITRAGAEFVTDW